MRSLGFEVFTPKAEFAVQSFAATHEFDSSLSIPAPALKRLNEFNFYEESWPADVVSIVNRYFGAVFVIPLGIGVVEAIDKFEGQIVLRAFGLQAPLTYDSVLEELHGSLLMYKIQGISSRFWFGECYEGLHECEPPLFQARAIYLPLGLPESYFADAGKWRGTAKKILFVCPNVITNPYYGQVYRDFKRDFGDLPHVIVGAQDVPVDDPNVTGFVFDNDLRALYRDCALLYYHSTEARHLHYSPVEATICGMPIVFYRRSLLDRLMPPDVQGAVDSTAEARDLVHRLLSGDSELSESLRSSQRDLGRYFSLAYCRQQWVKSMESRGFSTALASHGRISVLWTELRRKMMLPLAHGLTRVEPQRATFDALRPARVPEGGADTCGCALEDGVDFSVDKLASCLVATEGLSQAEPWGRWSTCKKVVIVLDHWLQGCFRLHLSVIGYGPNLGLEVAVRIGNVVKHFRLGREGGSHKRYGSTFVSNSLRTSWSSRFPTRRDRPATQG